MANTSSLETCQYVVKMRILAEEVDEVEKVEKAAEKPSGKKAGRGELERDIERRFVRRLAEHGVLCWKWVSPGRDGVPDRIVVIPGGVVVFVELKTSSGKLSPLQQTTLPELSGRGCDVRVLYGQAQADAFIAEVVTKYGL